MDTASPVDHIVYDSPVAGTPAFFLLAPTGEDVHQNRWANNTSPPFCRSGSGLNSGVDIPLPRDAVLPPGEVTQIGLGVRARCLRLGGGGKVRFREGVVVLENIPSTMLQGFWMTPRSSMSRPGPDGRALVLTNSMGLIDLSYTGELQARVFNLGRSPIELKAGEAIVQLTAPNLAPAESYWISPKRVKEKHWIDQPVHDKYFGPSAVLTAGRGEAGLGSTGPSGSNRPDDSNCPGGSD